MGRPKAAQGSRRRPTAALKDEPFKMSLCGHDGGWWWSFFGGVVATGGRSRWLW